MATAMATAMGTRLGLEDLEILSDQQLVQTCFRLEGRVRMLAAFLGDLNSEKATLQRQQAMLRERLAELELGQLGPGSPTAHMHAEEDAAPELKVPEEFCLRQSAEGVELSWRAVGSVGPSTSFEVQQLSQGSGGRTRVRSFMFEGQAEAVQRCLIDSVTKSCAFRVRACAEHQGRSVYSDFSAPTFANVESPKGSKSVSWGAAAPSADGAEGLMEVIASGSPPSKARLLPATHHDTPSDALSAERLRHLEGQVEQLRMEVFEHQHSAAELRQESAERLRHLEAREDLELRRREAQEKQLRMEVIDHHHGMAQLQQESAQRLRQLEACEDFELRRREALEEQLRMEVREHQRGMAQLKQESVESLRQLEAREDLEFRRREAQEEQLRMEVFEHQRGFLQLQQESVERLRQLEAREDLEFRRREGQEEQLRMELLQHQRGMTQLEQESAERLRQLEAHENLEFRRREAQEEQLRLEVHEHQAKLVASSESTGSRQDQTTAGSWIHQITSGGTSSAQPEVQKLILGPTSYTHAVPALGTERSGNTVASVLSQPEIAQAEMAQPTAACGSRSPVPAKVLSTSLRSSPISTEARSPVQGSPAFCGTPSSLQWQDARSVEGIPWRVSAACGSELLPPPPRSSPARDIPPEHRDLREPCAPRAPSAPSAHVLTVLTSDNRWETLKFYAGNFEQQASDFLAQKKLKAAFVGGLAAKMKAMVAAGQVQSSVDIVDLI
ncbi:unnamed protein product [Symbiodinium natans]|uniref:Uncharacterized protein n=1 Tax=Symbiodinium natans TaxID=878477 RepID=A0A812R4P9_9DINO|nr:unnamed protein product [Symbiodinium natans]